MSGPNRAARAAIAGVEGRMGQALCAAIAADPRFTLVGATERPDSPALGALRNGATIVADVGEAARDAQVWIDFTTPAAVVDALAQLPTGCAAIIGATGFDTEHETAIRAAAGARVIVRSGNFSIGVTVLAALVEEASRRLGPDWDIEIVETHHRRKVDAPSGTALLLGEAAAAGRGSTLTALRAPVRDGMTGPRVEGSIGLAALRGGGVVGQHSVLFAAETETITLSHEAFDRALFAKGALVAAAWAMGQPPGLYSMRDVLGV